jgi:filamentous hemagglutinin family protein
MTPRRRIACRRGGQATNARGGPWRGRRLARIVWLLLAALPSSAQVPSNQGLVVRDESLGAGKGQIVQPGTDSNGLAADYLITPDLGQAIGDETLLHSFLDFGLATEEVATFTGAESLRHIVARVTGDTISDIRGTIRSTAVNADLYMINPNGFVFGEGAALDVRGSFNVTTADYLRWGEQRFEARAGGLVPTLAFAEPTAFGFVNPAPAALRFENVGTRPGTQLAVDPNETFSLVGGDISAAFSGLQASAGEMRVISVASEGEIVAGAPVGALDAALGEFDRLGTIVLGDFGMLDVSGERGGRVVVRGESLQVGGFSSAIRAHTHGTGDGLGIDVGVDHLLISGSRSRITANSALSPFFDTDLNELGDAGSIKISVDTLEIRRGGRVESSTSGAGMGGLIEIDANDSVEISDDTGAAGVHQGIFSFAYATATGKSGSIFVESPQLRLSNSGEIVAETHGLAAAGVINIDVGTLTLESGGRLSGAKTGSGTGTNIFVDADQSVLIEGRGATPVCGGDFCTSGILTASGPEASVEPGGDISIVTPILLMRDAGSVFTDSQGDATGGAINIVVDTLVMEGGARLSAQKLGTAASGNITVTATESITIGGVDSITQCGGAPCASGIYASASESASGEPAGAIVIQETPVLVLHDGGQISAGTAGAADAGSVSIDVDALLMSGGAVIETKTAGSGAGGIVTVDATNLISIADSAVITGATAGGAAGDIDLHSQAILLRDAVVSSENILAGDGGTISIRAGQLIDARRSTISTRVDAGDGGDINLEAGQLIALLDDTDVLANAPNGDGGRIVVTTPTFIRSSDSDLDASGGVTGGEVIINSPQQIIVDQVTPLPAEFLDASSMMLASCAARGSGERAGSFTVARWRGLPVSPEGPLLAFESIGSLPSTSVASQTSRRAVPTPPDAMTFEAQESAPLQLASNELDQGALAFRAGSLADASQHWQDASKAAAQSGNDPLEGDALRGVAQTEQLRGEYAASVVPLEQALELARRSGDRTREAAALGSLGNAMLAMRETGRASQYLDEAVAIARDTRDATLGATLLNNRGNQYATTGAYDEALTAYLESVDLATNAEDPLRVAEARANAARAALELGRSGEAADLLKRARLEVADLAPSRKSITLQIHLARSYRELALHSVGHWKEGMTRAHRILVQVSEQARAVADSRSLSYARGNLSALYELEGRYQEALALSQEALEIAEAAEAADLVARWQGQTGAILWAAGDTQSAVEFYRRAVDLVEETRPELRARYGSLDRQFQREVEPVYLALVDALLQEARDSGSPDVSQQRLAEARSTVERWKEAELRDYFRDECVSELATQAASAESLSPTAAVVYPIPLPDRLELLVSGVWGIERYEVAVGADQLAESAHEFRRRLGDRTSRGYLRPAQRLHEWLVAPYMALLEQRRIDTVVFIPSQELRTIPMAALHDGERFLMERFAVAVTPSLQLLAPQRLEPSESRLLLAGVSESVQDYPALSNVPTELSEIHALYGGELLLDEDFELARLEESLRERRPEVVHVASHATFTGDPATSFVLTHDTKLTMERLSELVGAGRFDDRPIELLVLSACSTASGDERAALGLSGVAIRAGARSALGSLWNVSDRASSDLIVRFYRELGRPHVSKAQALQHAQQQLLAQHGFEHPFYWAPFLMINNWL